MKKTIKLLSLFLAMLLLATSFISCKEDPENPNTTTTGAPGNNQNAVAYEDIDFRQINPDLVTVSETETDYVIITVADFGDIIIRLFPDVAPQTVANFKELVSQKFYDGLIFHRVIEGFMIQGGDPKGTGSGGSGKNLFGEFTNNGFTNNLKHTRGVVSMARRSDDNDSASSQFFICQEKYAYGDGDYASFGYVVSGMNVVDKIADVATNSSNKPLTNVVMTSIRFANVPDEAYPLEFDKIELGPVADAFKTEISETPTDYVLIDVANYGNMLVRLYPDVAPKTVANFKKLVSEQFYDGLIFHRVIEGFMIQGGDPEGDGSGGSDETIPGEFTNNGFVNNLKHVRGVVSMARLDNDPDSATSQFFICQDEYSYGDGDYAAFGYVIDGIEVVDEIVKVSTDAANKPYEDVVITSIRFVTVTVDTTSTETNEPNE